MEFKVYMLSRDGDLDKDYIRRKLNEIGIAKGDSIMCSCRLPFLGTLKEGVSFTDLSDVIIDEILDLIGRDGTLIVPSYSYAFCNKQVFEPFLTPSTLGIFFETFRKRKQVVRTLDPIFSVCITGKNSGFLSAGNSEDCFGKDSFFDRFHSLGQGKYLLIGLDYHYITNFHYVEQACNVKYRYIKEFPGTIVFPDGKETGRIQKFLVRDLDQYYDFKPFLGYIKEQDLGRDSVFCNSTIKAINDRVYFETVKNLLNTDERYFLKESGV